MSDPSQPTETLNLGGDRKKQGSAESGSDPYKSHSNAQQQRDTPGTSAAAGDTTTDQCSAQLTQPSKPLLSHDISGSAVQICPSLQGPIYIPNLSNGHSRSTRDRTEPDGISASCPHLNVHSGVCQQQREQEETLPNRGKTTEQQSKNESSNKKETPIITTNLDAPLLAHKIIDSAVQICPSLQMSPPLASTSNIISNPSLLSCCCVPGVLLCFGFGALIFVLVRYGSKMSGFEFYSALFAAVFVFTAAGASLVLCCGHLLKAFFTARLPEPNDLLPHDTLFYAAYPGTYLSRYLHPPPTNINIRSGSHSQNTGVTTGSRANSWRILSDLFRWRSGETEQNVPQSLLHQGAIGASGTTTTTTSGSPSHGTTENVAPSVPNASVPHQGASGTTTTTTSGPPSHGTTERAEKVL